MPRTDRENCPPARPMETARPRAVRTSVVTLTGLRAGRLQPLGKRRHRDYGFLAQRASRMAILTPALRLRLWRRSSTKAGPKPLITYRLLIVMRGLNQNQAKRFERFAVAGIDDPGCLPLE